MKINKTVLTTLLALTSLVASAQDYNPYKPIGKKTKVLTLSKGKYDEFFDTDTIQRIGSILLNIHNGKIVRLLNTDSTYKKASDNSTASRWYSPDPMGYMYFSLSPYNYVANDPIKNTDPDGKLIMGETRDDARKFKDDLNQMLKDKAFDNFRKLVSVKGKAFKSIDKDAFDKAVDGLNDDQKAFAQTVFNTINSKDEHVVEYVSKDGEATQEGSELLAAQSEKFKNTLESSGGRFKGSLIAAIWGSTTVKSLTGTHSIIVDGLSPEEAGNDYLNSKTTVKSGNPAGRPSTAGHEVLGHGRFISQYGEDVTDQHVNAIRMENLILRVMGHGEIQRTGEDHKPRSIVPEPSALPKY